MPSLNDRVEWYLTARQKYEDAKHASDKAYGLYKAAESDLVSAMIEDCTAGIKRDNGISLYLRKQVSCSVTEENNHQIRDWLVENEGDDMPYVKESVSKKAVLELLRRKIEEEHIPDDEFPKFMRVSSRPGLSVRGWKVGGDIPEHIKGLDKRFAEFQDNITEPNYDGKS